MKENQGKAKGPARRIAGLAVVVAAALSVSGCQPKSTINYIFGKNHIMEGMDLKYSYNVTTAPKWWPDEDSFDTEKEAVGDAQEQYYAQHGKPDYFRLYYNKAGSVLPREAVSAHQGIPKPQGVSWIYLDRELEVTFSATGAEEEPLTDEIRALCELGDPDEIKNISQDASVRHVRYIYRQEGTMIDFVDGEKEAVQATKPMPGWMR